MIKKMRNHVPLSFPATRKALWSHAPIGGSFTLLLPKLCVSVTEQVLFLANGQARSAHSENCYFCGKLSVEADCTSVALALNQFDKISTDEAKVSSVPGDVRMVTKLMRKSRNDESDSIQQNHVETALTLLADRAYSGDKVELAGYMQPIAVCTLFTGSNQIHADVNIDVITLGSEFTLSPIESVAVATTALSKSILGPDRYGAMGGKQKSGFLTMDQYRKVVFLLESDPKIITLPIIGIWVSGVDLIADPFIWTSCLRYLHTKNITDRVCKPNEPFLLVHKSDIEAQPTFYDCTPESTNLNYILLSGRRGIAIEKEVQGKRKESAMIDLSLVSSTSAKGRQFQQILTKIDALQDKENSEISQTTKMAKTAKKLLNDDVAPRITPSPHNNTPKSQFGFSVPDVSMLDESTPQAPPKPSRQALRTISDVRLNSSPHKPNLANDHTPSRQILKTKQQVHAHETTARKIMFDEVDAEQPVTDRVITQILARTPPQLRSSVPSLRSPHTVNGSQPAQRPANVAALTPNRKSNQTNVHENYPSSGAFQQYRPGGSPSHAMPSRQPAGIPPQQLMMTAQTGDQHINYYTPPHSDHFHVSPPSQVMQQQGQMPPFAAVSPRPQMHQQSSYQPCKCQMHASQQYQQSAYNNGASAAPVSPQHNHAETVTVTYQHKLSPVLYSQRSPARLKTPSPLSVNTQQSHMSSALTPEVKEILQNQEKQLKTLQQQIQHLLAIQECKQLTGSNSMETQTTRTRQSMCVNTGVSLLAPCVPGSPVSSNDPVGSQNEANDSSGSHSLIQHDFTGLELPMQVTARSFSSELNVDYESYEDSPSSSPKRQGSSEVSDSSWQSPVLGESVSMIAANNDAVQKSTKQQLGNIIQNVKELLAKHSPTKKTDVQQTSTSVESSPLKDLPSMDSTPSKAESSSLDVIPTKEVRTADDVAEATRNQLTKMGIATGPPERPLSHDLGAALPHIQYISMVLTDSMTSESDRSMEFNALAMKYLKDEQLTELAQFTMSSKKNKGGQSSMLRQVLTMNSGPDVSTYDSRRNMSFATQQYMKRYALASPEQSVASNESTEKSPEPPKFFYDTPGRNLKSILKWNNQQPEHDPEQSQSSNGKDQTMSTQVLDLEKLRELPKLL